jgi:hypothetical protein
MVRAILDGRKTQTRRVMASRHFSIGEYQRQNGSVYLRCHEFDYRNSVGRYECGSGPFDLSCRKDQEYAATFCQYGVPGDRLWVRETLWTCIDNNDRPRYVADGPAPTTDRRHYKKVPAIFCQRVRSRLTLEITDVRVGRLQSISEADAWAEGIGQLTPGNTKSNNHNLIVAAAAALGLCSDLTPSRRRFLASCASAAFAGIAGWLCGGMNYPKEMSSRQAFSVLWDSINAKRGFGWSINPWVWAITFKRVED